MIGEREKNWLPFVNMCLRAWMEMLSDDLDLWADLSPLDFDKWLAEEMTKAKDNNYRGRTSYELMMAIFGEKSGKPTPLPAADRTSRKKKNLSTTSWKTDQPDMIPPTKTSDTVGRVRKSKIRMLGEVMRKALLRSSSL